MSARGELDGRPSHSPSAGSTTTTDTDTTPLLAAHPHHARTISREATCVLESGWQRRRAMTRP